MRNSPKKLAALSVMQAQAEVAQDTEAAESLAKVAKTVARALAKQVKAVEVEPEEVAEAEVKP